MTLRYPNNPSPTPLKVLRKCNVEPKLASLCFKFLYAEKQT